MANLTSVSVDDKGATIALDDGTTQVFLFPVVAPATGPTEAQVQADVDATIQKDFTAPQA